MRKRHALPPGPRPHPLLGNLPEFRRDPLGFLPTCARLYGDIACFHIGPVTAYLLNHPDYIEHVLVRNSRSFAMGRTLRASRILLGDGLLTSEGEAWLRQRRLAQPAFHRERISGYGRIVVETADKTLAAWQDGEVRDLHQEMKRLTREVIARCLFSTRVGAEAEGFGLRLQFFWDQFAARMTNGLLIPAYLPTPSNLRMRAAIRQMDDTVYNIIRRRRQRSEAAGEADGDLLSLLLSARDEDGQRLSDRQLRDEVMTLFVAGHETTAVALTWTWFLLAHHPEVEARLLAEVEVVCGGRAPGPQDLPRLRYVEMVLKESLRLYPPAWGIPRLAAEDCEIGGYFVPAGTSLTLSPWVTQRDPRYFDDPGAFRPERWESEEVAALPTYAYFPFGGGPRQCIGYSLAIMEATLLIAMIIPRFHFALVPEHPVVPWPSITLYPRYGLKALVRMRGG